MLPNRHQRLPVSFKRSNIEMWNVEAHRTLLPIYLKEITHMIKIGKGKSQLALHHISKINVRLSKKWSRVKPVFHEASREKWNVEAPAVPSHHDIITLQTLCQFRQQRLLLTRPPRFQILALSRVRHE